MTKDEAKIITNALIDEVSNCYQWLDEFDILFPADNLHYEMYNEIAPHFFIKIRKLFFEFFFMNISKLLDGAKMNKGKNENLSIFQLEEIAKIYFQNGKERLRKRLKK
ncbi:MAG: hypothetical protein ACQESW_07710 [Bacteroidota bacterium]